MLKIPFIKKKIGTTYLVWFHKSNLYVRLEEPAWFVFSRTLKRYKLETLAKICAERYDLTESEGLNYVNEIRSGIEEMNQPTDLNTRVSEYPDDLATYTFEPYSKFHYRCGDNNISFSYETRIFEYYIHPLINHLEIEEISEESAVFELFAYYDKIAFRLNGIIKGLWTYEETHLVKGLIFMNLINVIFQKDDDFWLMTVHASAITDGKKSILIPAEPGSGKTTMAALLQDRGFKLVSDDFVPIDRNSFAYPFPIAMSVKQGAVSLLATIYPDLEEKPLNYINPQKIVRYLSPENDHDFYKRPLPVKEFVFIKYDPSVEFEWIRLDPITGIKKLLDQSWVSPKIGTAEILFEYLANWSFCQLTYSNNEKALEVINNLFQND